MEKLVKLGFFIFPFLLNTESLPELSELSWKVKMCSLSYESDVHSFDDYGTLFPISEQNIA